MLSEMRANLKDIPRGCKRTEIGILLRKAWFINGCFLLVKCRVGTVNMTSITLRS